MKMEQHYQHQSVLLDESVQALSVKPDGVYVDCTMGGAGHSRRILEELGPQGILVCFDQDSDAWPNTPKDARVILVKENFRYLHHFLHYYGIGQVDGVLADIGVSSYQFDKADRGFSTRFDAALDMRMDNRATTTAALLLANKTEKELHVIFEKNGEVRNARTLAKTIVEGRRNRKLESIDDFKALIAPCIIGNPAKYLAQVFQALRIEVNEELEALKEFLIQTPACLKTGGRLAVITFHSLEDRLVKQFMKNGTFELEAATDIFGRGINSKPFKVLKDVLPSETEQKNNPRSRSARLRIAEKL